MSDRVILARARAVGPSSARPRRGNHTPPVSLVGSDFVDPRGRLFPHRERSVIGPGNQDGGGPWGSPPSVLSRVRAYGIQAFQVASFSSIHFWAASAELIPLLAM